MSSFHVIRFSKYSICVLTGLDFDGWHIVKFWHGYLAFKCKRSYLSFAWKLLILLLIIRVWLRILVFLYSFSIPEGAPQKELFVFSHLCKKDRWLNSRPDYSTAKMYLNSLNRVKGKELKLQGKNRKVSFPAGLREKCKKFPYIAKIPNHT